MAVVVSLDSERGKSQRPSLAALNALAAEKFKARLPGAKISDGSKLVDWIRLIKSDLEIGYMREASALVDAEIGRAHV